jgi:hypothetical protein
MTPKTAIETLRTLGWSDHRIAVAVDATQPTIWRIRSSDPRVSYEIGAKLVAVAKRESRKANA